MLNEHFQQTAYIGPGVIYVLMQRYQCKHRKRVLVDIIVLCGMKTQLNLQITQQALVLLVFWYSDTLVKIQLRCYHG